AADGPATTAVGVCARARPVLFATATATFVAVPARPGTRTLFGEHLHRAFNADLRARSDQRGGHGFFADFGFRGSPDTATQDPNRHHKRFSNRDVLAFRFDREAAWRVEG